MSEVQFIKTQRGGHLLLYEHNLYRIQCNRRNSSYWKCGIKTNEGTCKARIVLKNGVITKYQGDHTHPPDIQKLTRMAFYNKLKTRCESESSEPLSKLYKEEVAKFAQTVEVASCLPNIKTAVRPMLSHRKKGAKKSDSSVSVQKNEDPMSAYTEEVILPDVEIACSESSEMETHSGAATSPKNNSDIIVKDEIIETELEPSVITGLSFHSSFADDSSSKTQLGQQEPSTSYMAHLESSNSNTNILANEQSSTLAHGLKIENVEYDVSANFSGDNSENNDTSSNVPFYNSALNVAGPESLSKDESIQHRFFSRISDPSFSSVINRTSPGSSSKNESTQHRVPSPIADPPFPSVSNFNQYCQNEPIQPCGSSCKRSPSLSQVVNSASHQNACNKESVESGIPFRLYPISPPRDRFDIFGEFVASKLRNLDPKSSVFVETTFSNLIFKAELGMFLGEEEKGTYAARANDVPNKMPSPNKLDSSLRKENIQPEIPSHRGNPYSPPDFNGAGRESSLRNETAQRRVSSPLEDPSISNHAGPVNLLRNESTRSRVSSPIADTSSSPVSNHSGPETESLPRVNSLTDNPQSPGVNATVSETTSIDNPIQTTVSSHTEPPSLPLDQNRERSLSGMPIQSSQCHMRPRDEFDAYGEFAASKLRNMDPRSCVFIQTIFANLIFEAELGRFLSADERSIFANKTNDIFRNMPPANDSELDSLKNIVSNLSKYPPRPRYPSFTPPTLNAEVPLEYIQNLHYIYK